MSLFLLDHTLNSQNLPYTSSLKVSCRVSIVSIQKKTSHVYLYLHPTITSRPISDIDDTNALGEHVEQSGEWSGEPINTFCFLSFEVVLLFHMTLNPHVCRVYHMKYEHSVVLFVVHTSAVPSDPCDLYWWLNTKEK